MEEGKRKMEVKGSRSRNEGREGKFRNAREGVEERGGGMLGHEIMGAREEEGVN